MSIAREPGLAAKDLTMERIGQSVMAVVFLVIRLFRTRLKNVDKVMLLPPLKTASLSIQAAD